MTRPYRSGHCGLSNPPKIHAQCNGSTTNRGETLPCVCACHDDPEEPDPVIAPGIVSGLPNEAYHADRDYLSSTYLKSLLPERYTQPTSRDALDVGTVFHTRTLGTDEEIVIVDAASWRGKAAAEERQAAWARGAVPILADDSDRIDAMVKAVHEHDEAAALIAQAHAGSEVSVFAHDEAGIGHKARFDLLGGLAVDLKSTAAKPGADSLTRTVIDYGYDLSAAHYLEVAAMAGIEVDGFEFIFCSKTAPHRVTVAGLDETFLARGRILRALAIERHLATAPPYDGATGRLTLTAPRWARLTTDTPAAGIPADFAWSLDDYS